MTRGAFFLGSGPIWPGPRLSGCGVPLDRALWPGNLSRGADLHELAVPTQQERAKACTVAVVQPFGPREWPAYHQDGEVTVKEERGR